MDYKNDDRSVMTLDAGGTNLVFGAMAAGEMVIKPFTLPSLGHDLKMFLDSLVKGFKRVREELIQEPCAISFSFPGPSEFGLGIIGDLENLPAFHGGVALGPMLQERFNLPVFINNDGDLFAYGEAMAGFLPKINGMLKKENSPKRYANLLGVTLGSGFGAGIVSQKRLLFGDNWAGGEINRMRNRSLPFASVEESVSINGVRRAYAHRADIELSASPSPKHIFLIAKGQVKGNQTAAKEAFIEMAIVASDALANAISLIDGLIVIGGGLAKAHEVFLDRLVMEMNQSFCKTNGKLLNRLESKVFNLQDQEGLRLFLKGEKKTITIPHTDNTITYDPLKRVGVGLTELGTTKAIGLGAYIFALTQLDMRNEK